MSPSRMIRSSVSILFLMVGAVLSALPQVQQSAALPANEVKTEEAKFYADAHPYMDEQPAKLEKVVHELDRLEPTSDQDQLPGLLTKTGAVADELLQTVPNLISDEVISEAQYGKGSRSQGDQTFNYLMLIHPAHDGRLVLSEYRTTRNGESVPQAAGSPNFHGFLSAWLVFSSENRVESRFRYLGQQQTDGHSTFVIGFAQIPGSVESPGQVWASEGPIPLLLQGIAWIDQSDFRIVRLRTDLLAPQPAIQLQEQTVKILFGSVHIALFDSALWLPQRADFEMESKGQLSYEEHKYSKYRLYKPTVSPKPAASAQTPNLLSGTGDDVKTEATKLYAGAHPYMDDPLPELKKTVHALAGLKPAPNQEQLSDLLAKVGAEADELFHKVPNLISDEAVSEAEWPASEGLMDPGCADECFGTGSGLLRDRAFNYLILVHPTRERQLLLSEYRTTRNGKPVLQAAGEPNFQGFVSAWVVFSSPNQVESRFRYLGQQQMGGHSTCVIGFAQIPGSTESPSRIQAGSESIPMLLQGIAWVDQSDFRIVRLRTDLLAPQPEIQVQKQTANILFGPVRIAQLDSELWLPQAVNLEMEARGQFFQEQHKYSKYRLYQAKSRIVLSPDN